MGAFEEAPHGTTAAEVAARARRRGAVPHEVDASASRGKDAALDAFGRALSFPSWYGRNLDALYDCLTDLSWLPAGEHVLVWPGHRALGGVDRPAYEAVRTVLAEAAQANPRLSVVLTDS
ncbi:Barstar, RNAse (barnase) inhibitor [Streptoalloteichus tenebrarius]|uniref:Barstar, RNAse (Barnase) inhibitor n=1 Tax=Streptoalloteichus tenebrarius (strain ATCC 17920 / DSM 40477 / JCM 4838 / CBS 697.72 / NBRC 16177 / NCIMB 11028 / NRRL B-12390 / A12253. 1 / ISP 5477) TaxID=1933 RepID=A0ABT1HZ74_STRSD|nr:barstar family protein [Streptoalloteichus tenebrarius]MCP2260832.1 Barstar, RNAse (barnase) inhibitor [Streptoalloteichus tenebrarius]BFF00494.1 barstar family protein [Streptoalloteichus tenebrarius]